MSIHHLRKSLYTIQVLCVREHTGIGLVSIETDKWNSHLIIYIFSTLIIQQSHIFAAAVPICGDINPDRLMSFIFNGNELAVRKDGKNGAIQVHHHTIALGISDHFIKLFIAV